MSHDIALRAQFKILITFYLTVSISINLAFACWLKLVL
jgi:hypothetical protein